MNIEWEPPIPVGEARELMPFEVIEWAEARRKELDKPEGKLQGAEWFYQHFRKEQA